MLSILIPTYNYNCYSLVKELKQQADGLNFDYEIIVQDDCSSLFIAENSEINELQNCSFEINSNNLGRTKNRLLLIQKSKFDDLLFLDSDVFPKENDFIKKYVDQIVTKKSTVVYGGLIYKESNPSKNEMLRWVYGKNRESIPLKKRLLNPYQNVLTSNLLLNKKIVERLEFNENLKTYGYEDFVLAQDLKKIKIPITHIDNAIYHLNLETSEIFIEKIRISLHNLKSINKKGENYTADNRLLFAFSIVQKINLLKPIAFLFTKFKTKMEHQLLSNSPKIIILDLYKLGYFCKINLE
jgi:glycosyltransferase involved in cell wall biosynthesis